MISGASGPLAPAAGGVTLAVRVTPKARRAGIGPLKAGAEGAGALGVSVTAPPENGKANDAVIALLAKHWKLPRSAFDILSGATARNKTLKITGDTDVLLREIGNRIGEIDG